MGACHLYSIRRRGWHPVSFLVSFHQAQADWRGVLHEDDRPLHVYVMPTLDFDPPPRPALPPSLPPLSPLAHVTMRRAATHFSSLLVALCSVFFGLFCWFSPAYVVCDVPSSMATTDVDGTRQ